VFVPAWGRGTRVSESSLKGAFLFDRGKKKKGGLSGRRSHFRELSHRNSLPRRRAEPMSSRKKRGREDLNLVSFSGA